MNNINNRLVDKNEIETFINKYVNIYYDNLQKDLKENDPFNVNSVILKKQKRTVIKVNNIENIQKAFIHKSFWNTTNVYDETDSYSCLYFDRNIYGDYEITELQGDRVIELITIDFLKEKFPDKDEGFLTSLKSRIVRKETLVNLGEALNFKKYILLSSYLEKITRTSNGGGNGDSGRETKRFLEDIFEAFIGNLYIDQNFNKEKIKPFLLGMYQTHLDLDYLVNSDINYKTLLLKFFHSQKFEHPKYTDLYFIGGVLQREFTTIILLEKSVFENSEYSKDPLITKAINDKTSNFLKKLSAKEYQKLIESQPNQVNLRVNKLKNNSVSYSIFDLAQVIKSLDLKNLDADKNLKSDICKLKEKLDNITSNFLSPYDYLLEILNVYVFLGIGIANKKQEAEQECSKDCLRLFNQM